jgi:tRNA (cmo5U34)-methyltransferase
MIGIDSNKQMIKIAKSKLISQKKLLKRQNDDLIKKQIEFQCKDLLKINNFQKSNLFISILLFPFLNYEERKKILDKIYQALEFGGALICVDKVRAKRSEFEDIFNQVYFDFKIKKKLSSNQILSKSRSLRSSMHLFNQDEINDLFHKSKFNKTEVFFRWFNFIGFIAIK